ncbi:hypothetical protein [Nocardia wallacei]|uniref:hypothetical protein n=1 Tax=Nocardia wallacei TaxID=480035 RepID=UPI0024560B16|nr:hypothetical protein [Nocardia wallacei]
MVRRDLAGSARLELVSGVVQLHPEDALVEAMLRGWRAQQAARGLPDATIAPRERVVRRFLGFTNEYPWNWLPGHVEEWSLWMTSERRLAPSTIRGNQTVVRLFSEYLCDARYGWARECEERFGPGVHPVPICHEWNTIVHLNDYEGNPEARPFTRGELQRFFDHADEQVERAVRAKRKGALAAYRDATLFKVMYGWGFAADGDLEAGSGRLGPQPGCSGVRALRHAACPLRQGGARAAAAAAQCSVGDGVGSPIGSRLCRPYPSQIRVR